AVPAPPRRPGGPRAPGGRLHRRHAPRALVARDRAAALPGREPRPRRLARGATLARVGRPPRRDGDAHGGRARGAPAHQAPRSRGDRRPSRDGARQGLPAGRRGIVRPARVWLVFAACATALLGAMVWISLTVLRLERAEQQARAQAALEENTRLALWRLDSALIPLLAQEGRSEMPPEYLLRFQIAPGGEVTSPQVPALARRLESLRTTLRGADLAAQLPRQPPAPPPSVTVAANDQASIQKKKNVQEYAARQQSLSNSVLSQTAAAPPVLAPRPLPPREGAPTALWVGDVLLLARRVGVGDAEYIQGTWLDWPRLRKDLLASIQDLLPGARLEPVTAGARPDEERRLATLPVRLVTGPAPLPESTGPSPVRLSLAGAWAFAFLAALAVATLLRGVVELSERRHVFVS